MRGKVGWVLWLSMGAVLLSSRAQAQCTKDVDCKGDRVCEAGKCIAPSAAPPPATPPTAADSPSAAPSSVDDASATPAPAAPPEEAKAPKVEAPQPANAPATSGRDATPFALAAPPADEPATRRRSKSAMVGGIVMVSAAPIALLVALSARNAQEGCDDRLLREYPGGVLPPSQRYRVDDCDGYSVPIYVFGIGGAVLAAVGIPLIVYGAKRVPVPRASGSVQMLPWATHEGGGLRLRLTL